MKLHYNAESLLYAKATSLKHESQGSWRGIYGNLSRLNERRSQLLRNHFMVRTIAELLEEEEGHIYICDDGDMFILFQGALRPIVAKLGKHFEELGFEQFWKSPEGKMFTAFDLSVHWRSFISLCHSKLFQSRFGTAGRAAYHPFYQSAVSSEQVL